MTPPSGQFVLLYRGTFISRTSNRSNRIPLSFLTSMTFLNLNKIYTYSCSYILFKSPNKGFPYPIRYYGDEVERLAIKKNITHYLFLTSTFPPPFQFIETLLFPVSLCVCHTLRLIRTNLLKYFYLIKTG